MFGFVGASFLKRTRVTGLGMLGLLVACGGKPAHEESISAAQLDALPRLTVKEGASICTVGEPADTGCPVQTAIANWLGADEFAVWEAGHPVVLWQAGKRIVLVVKDTAIASQYRMVTAVGPGNSRNEVTVLDPIAGVAHRYRIDGTQVAAKTLEPITQLSVWGYYGATPVWQVMETSADNLTADVVVRVGKDLGDEKARVAFRANLPWLHLMNGSVTAAPPLFPNSVVYAFAENGEVIWSDGSHFVVERDGTNGKPVWKLTSDVVGPPVDSIDIARRRAELKGSDGLILPEQMLDSMTVNTAGTKHPAINGIVVAPSGAILVARAMLPQRDSIDYIRLTSDGVPTDRFTMSKQMALVLFAGDSVLVHYRPEGEARRLLWMHLAMPR